MPGERQLCPNLSHTRLTGKSEISDTQPRLIDTLSAPEQLRWRSDRGKPIVWAGCANINQSPNTCFRMRKKIKVASSTRKNSNMNMICPRKLRSNYMSVVFQPANRYVPDNCLTVTICLCRERVFFTIIERLAFLWLFVS